MGRRWWGHVYRERGVAREPQAGRLRSRWSSPTMPWSRTRGLLPAGGISAAQTPRQRRFVFCNASKLVHSCLPEGYRLGAGVPGTSGKGPPLKL